MFLNVVVNMKSEESVMNQLRYMFRSSIVMTDNRATLKMSLEEIEKYMMEKYDDFYEWLGEDDL